MMGSLRWYGAQDREALSISVQSGGLREEYIPLHLLSLPPWRGIGSWRLCSELAFLVFMAKNYKL